MPRLSVSEALPDYGAVSDFSFMNQNGESFGSEDLDGEVWVANFIFTRCQSMCLLLTGKMKNLQDELSEQGIKLVSFSVDPEFDTSEKLLAYSKRFGAGSEWSFLTGEKDKVRELISGSFTLGVADATKEDLEAGAEAVMHSSRFVLLDGLARKRGYYDVSDSGRIGQLIRDAEILLKEKN